MWYSYAVTYLTSKLILKENVTSLEVSPPKNSFKSHMKWFYFVIMQRDLIPDRLDKEANNKKQMEMIYKRLQFLCTKDFSTLPNKFHFHLEKLQCLYSLADL